MTAAVVPLNRCGNTKGRQGVTRPFALQPLLDAAQARSGLPAWDCGTFRGFQGFSLKRAALMLAVLDRQLYRWRASGLTEYQADELACRLGLHPAEVWGPEWWRLASPD